MKIQHSLPFGLGDMTPFISEVTMYLHFNKHHQGYVNNYNNAIESHEDLNGKSLEEVLSILAAEINSGNVVRVKLFENGAQAFNHNFFWNSLKRGGSAENHLIDRDAFIAAGMSQFGSGWLWIVRTNDGEIDMCTTSNADSPLFSLKKYRTIKYNIDANDTTPLLVFDLWEHGYYVDYQNRRIDYLKMIFDLANWDKV